MDVRAEAYQPAVRGNLFQEHFEQCRFPCAVGSDDGHLVPALDIEKYILKNLMPVVGFGKVFSMQHVAPADNLRRERQAHLVGQGFGTVEPFHFVQCLFAAFRAFNKFFAVVGAQCADYIFLPLDFLLLQIIGFLLAFPQNFFLLAVKSIIAVENRRFFVFDFNDLRDDPVQKIAVVRYKALRRNRSAENPPAILSKRYRDGW